MLELERPALYETWSAFLRATSGRQRQDILALVRHLVPVITNLGGPAAVHDAAIALTAIGRVWK